MNLPPENDDDEDENVEDEMIEKEEKEDREKEENEEGSGINLTFDYHMHLTVILRTRVQYTTASGVFILNSD